MIRTRVGYAGGTTKNPNYRNMGDHTEVFQVDFDRTKTSFADLLAVFWSQHNPCARAWSTQYKAILFYDGDEQKKVAEASAKAVSIRLGDTVRTELRSAGTFTRAEDYHQKYSLRRYTDLVEDLKAIYPTERAFQDATAVAKVHGYIDTHLTLVELRAELEALGLRAVGEDVLEGIERAPAEAVEAKGS